MARERGASFNRSESDSSSRFSLPSFAFAISQSSWQDAGWLAGLGLLIGSMPREMNKLNIVSDTIPFFPLEI